jgi:hypothetical protein
VFASTSITSVASTASIASVASVFLGLLFCTNRDAHADERVHVKRPVNVGDMGQRMVGAPDDAVHLSNVRPVVRSNHDGVECGG